MTHQRIAKNRIVRSDHRIDVVLIRRDVDIGNGTGMIARKVRHDVDHVNVQQKSAKTILHQSR